MKSERQVRDAIHRLYQHSNRVRSRMVCDSCGKRNNTDRSWTECPDCGFPFGYFLLDGDTKNGNSK